MISISSGFCWGRGRGNVLPSWMTSNDQLPAPGSGAPIGLGGDSGGPIQSVEDALAVLEAYGVKHSKREKKAKKHKSRDKKMSSKHRKEKDRHRHKKRRHRRGSSGNSSDSGSH
ncbi:hypothetical protein NADE_004163 [Nannochloris sp. 'desiccata']|nr:hypothetical protein NADE_004163 [Chlorella desiccata (nom. nud.)]